MLTYVLFGPLAYQKQRVLIMVRVIRPVSDSLEYLSLPLDEAEEVMKELQNRINDISEQITQMRLLKTAYESDMADLSRHISFLKHPIEDDDDDWGND